MPLFCNLLFGTRKSMHASCIIGLQAFLNPIVLILPISCWFLLIFAKGVLLHFDRFQLLLLFIIFEFYLLIICSFAVCHQLLLIGKLPWAQRWFCIFLDNFRWSFLFDFKFCHIFLKAIVDLLWLFLFRCKINFRVYNIRHFNLLLNSFILSCLISELFEWRPWIYQITT